MTDIPEFLATWISKIKSNDLASLYLLPFRRLNANQFSLLFEAMANCTSLTTFSASGHSISPECFSSLYNAITENTSLLTLDIGNNKMGLITDEELKNENSNSNLFIVLCKAIAKNKGIQNWNLEYKSIGLNAAKVFSENIFSNNQTLTSLLLARNQLGDDGCITLCNGLIKSQNNTIKILNLIDNGIGKRGIIEGIAKLFLWEVDENENDDNSNKEKSSDNSNTCCSIKELDLSLNKFGDEGGVVIGNTISNALCLRQLNLSNTDIGDSTVISICKGIEDNINRVNSKNENDSSMNNSQKSSEDAPKTEENKSSLKLISLIKLSLNNNNITHNSCQAIASLLSKNPKLYSLSLKNNKIGDIGMKIMACEGLNTITSNDRLNELDLSNNEITFEGFKYIIQYLPKIKVIVLHHNEINQFSKEFLDTLSFDDQFIGCSSLKELHLTENKVKTEDMILLCNMLKNGYAKNLEELVLGANISMDNEEEWNKWEECISNLENQRTELSITWK